MEKHYQIFISSTFKDLIEERQAVLKGVLELGHMPAGMELFPASDQSAWELIKNVIDSSDYYILIIGGMYGSRDETGIGYTEKEYRYAVSKGKPILAFLHRNPDNLPRSHTETKEDAWGKLTKFRNLVEKERHCSYWETAQDLKSSVIIGLNNESSKNPAEGWVRATKALQGQALFREWDDRFFKDRLETAERVYQQAISSYQFLNANEKFISGFLEKGGLFRFILLKPKGDAIKMAARRHSGASGKISYITNQLKNCKIKYDEFKSVSLEPENIQFKVIDHLIEPIATIIDPHLPQGVMFITFSGFEVPWTSRPSSIFHKSKNEKWFEFYFKSFQNLWDHPESTDVGEIDDLFS